jgi:hypothetical protein
MQKRRTAIQKGATMSENPFEQLHLPPSASDEEAVQQAEHLCRCAPDEPARNVIRQAVRQLTGSAEERGLYALLAHPRPDYDNSALDRFGAAFRRPPKSQTAPGPVPALDLNEVRDLLRQALLAELEVTPLPLEAVPADDSPEEIARQTVEALWQGLLSDMRA